MRTQLLGVWSRCWQHSATSTTPTLLTLTSGYMCMCVCVCVCVCTCTCVCVCIFWEIYHLSPPPHTHMLPWQPENIMMMELAGSTVPEVTLIHMERSREIPHNSHVIVKKMDSCIEYEGGHTADSVSSTRVHGLWLSWSLAASLGYISCICFNTNWGNGNVQEPRPRMPTSILVIIENSNGTVL